MSLGEEVDLRRHPPTKNSSLRAWDAADEYLLTHLSGSGVAGARWLLVNDGFGALSVPLADRRPTVVSDSILAIKAIEMNLARNQVESGLVKFVSGLEPLSGTYDVVLVKVPKTLALLEYQLHQLRPHISESTVVVGAGMVKQVHTSTLDLFERIVGPTTTSLAKKKARLIHSQFDPAGDPGECRFPTSYTTDGGVVAVNHANVFSQSRLDIGTRFLLENLPAADGAIDVIDLGCGNGLLGTTMATTFDGGSMLFTDISFMAVESARETYEGSLPGDGRGKFETADGLAEVESASFDLVLNNPPFHDSHVVGDETAWRMFKDSRRVLRIGGELRVVGNRHLGYHVKLEKLFGNCETIAANKKFVVLSARR